MSTKYFQGKTVTGSVHASTASTFREVVDLFRLPTTLPLTRAAFLALDKDKRDEAKMVPFFTPARFTESPSKRRYEFADDCNLIFLDIDPEKEKREGRWVETGRYPAAPFVRNPDSLHQALAGFNFVAHTTASSTLNAPRMRIVIEATGIPVARYPAAVATVGAMLGLPCITQESKVAVQPMFLPTLFRDSTAEDDPVIGHCLDGRAFVEDDIVVQQGPTLQNGSNGHTLNGNGEHPPKEPPASVDALSFLRAPLPEITLAVAEEALEHMDADCSYHEWLDIGSALRHQFSPRQADEAYALFDSWSAKGTKYKNTKETKDKWNSIRQTPVGRMPVTIRTLLRNAASSGWDDKKVKDIGFHAVLAWMGSPSVTITELIEHGVQKIIAAPMLSAQHEGMLVDQLKVHAKERFNFRVSATDIREDIRRIKQEMKAQSRGEEKTKEPTWAKGVCFISSAGDFYRHRTGEKYKAESFNAMYARFLLPTAEQLQEFGLAPTPGNLATPIVSPANYSLNHLKILTAYDYAYDPSQPTDVLFVKEGKKYINTYRPTYPDLDPVWAARAGELILHHLSNLVAEPEYRRILIDYLAFQVQQPGRKCRWAPLLQGAEGCGKTFLAEMMKAVLGSVHVKSISGVIVRSQWNDWAFGHQLVVLEEVRAVGTSRHDIMDALKPLITNRTAPVNERFRGSREVDSVTNYMLFSNHHDALALGPGDRRYFVLKSPLQTKAQVRALGQQYFSRLFTMLEEHPGAVRSFLMEWEISPEFQPDAPAPATKYGEDMIADSATDLTAAVRRLLLEADSPLLQYDIVSHGVLANHLLMEDGLRRPASQQVSQVLREEGFQNMGRHEVGAERHYLWSRGGLTMEEAVVLARDREKRGLKNLCMELTF